MGAGRLGTFVTVTTPDICLVRPSRKASSA